MVRRHGRPGDRDAAPVPMVVIDGIRHFSSGSHVAPRPADARRHH
jgi:hypothetical protein